MKASGPRCSRCLFITIACGACSGFHSLVGSGTTSKQIKRESDTKLIGYGAMLMEGVVAVIALSSVMILTKDSELLKKSPNFVYASGIGSFMQLIGVSPAFGISFGLMAFTTFVYDTLDICVRLGRFIIQELTGWKGWFGRNPRYAHRWWRSGLDDDRQLDRCRW